MPCCNCCLILSIEKPGYGCQISWRFVFFSGKIYSRSCVHNITANKPTIIDHVQTICAHTLSTNPISLIATGSLLPNRPPTTYPLKSLAEWNIGSSFLYWNLGEEGDDGAEGDEESFGSRRTDPEMEWQPEDWMRMRLRLRMRMRLNDPEMEWQPEWGTIGGTIVGFIMEIFPSSILNMTNMTETAEVRLLRLRKLDLMRKKES